MPADLWRVVRVVEIRCSFFVILSLSLRSFQMVRDKRDNISVYAATRTAPLIKNNKIIVNNNEKKKMYVQKYSNGGARARGKKNGNENNGMRAAAAERKTCNLLYCTRAPPEPYLCR